MAIEAHLAELSEKHRKVDEAIQQERQSPSSDPLHITELKKQKLRLKEQIETVRVKASA